MSGFSGHNHTEETKKRISLSLKEYLAVNEHHKGFSGKNHTTKSKKKISKKLKEYFTINTVSEDTRLRMSQAAVKRWLKIKEDKK